MLTTMHTAGRKVFTSAFQAPAAANRLAPIRGERTSPRPRPAGVVAAAAAATATALAITAGGASAGTLSASTDIAALPYAPVVTVNSPTPANYHYSEQSDGLPRLWFDGQATDPQDGAIPGTRMRWVATDERGTQVELCRGSSWPSSGDPGARLTLLRDCSEFGAAKLGRGTWRIELQAVDGVGNRGSATTTVVVIYVPS